jgi:hypothetical protein
MATARKTSRKIAARKTASSKRPKRAATAPTAAAFEHESLLKADTGGQEPRRADEMSPSERDATEKWLADTRNALGKHATALAGQIAAAPTGDRKDELLKIKGQLLDDQQTLDQREEAFFADGSTETMRAPSAEQVMRTRDLSEALGEAIASQKEAEAIAKLASDLADLALKVSEPG